MHTFTKVGLDALLTPENTLLSRLVPVFADLNQYDATMHFLGQSIIFTLTDRRATGEAYYLAHHVTVEGNERRLMLASSLSRHVHKGRRIVAVRGAPALFLKGKSCRKRNRLCKGSTPDRSSRSYRLNTSARS